MLKKIVFILSIVSVIVACSSSDDSNGGSNDNFDRTALLTNYADNIIVPALVNFQSKMSDMETAKSDFINDINQTNLNILSDAWLEAYKAWQHVEIFNIGIAETLSADENSGFVVFFNRYPVTVSDIEAGAASGNYDLNAISYYDAQGFPALDFLIHGVADSDTTPLDKFTTNPNFEGYANYITDVIAQMRTIINTVVSDWQGSYRDSFINNTSSSATGSFNKMVNDFIYYYEKGLRANKIGIPAGNFSVDPLPEKVEAYYKNDVSKELALLGLETIEKVFNGQAIVGSGASSQSFASYLDYLENSQLRDDINAQFLATKQQIQSLNNSFSQQVMEDNTQMTQAYDLLQGAVVLLKVDMASAFNVSIDFTDSDGD
ncbi:imelysin family protein [Winogradskyella ouciana]|uniref:Peptidase M75 superfamily protein n=1 Tax=Winogradskyella ouciana TaxID=2608631 RepID=A0A7K1GEP7_9FLAO|nr:imelysin family protein [Winogradskyella ouciana]MTE27782.1 peptidase M75 superfamily protein [Winogradskyella ouciana]